jgi:CRISPR-associated endonuclease Cas3-HD
MRPCAFTGQSLGAHLRCTAHIVQDMLVHGYAHTVARRLGTMGLNANPEEVEELILLAALFHDTGKAVTYYQKQFDNDRGCRSNKGPSFSYHEILSAVHFQRYLEKSGRKYNSELSLLAVLAVMNHMHAIRDYSDLVEAPGLQRSQIPPGLVVTLKESQVRAEDVEVLVMDLREFDVLDLDAFRDALARDITEKDVRDLLGMVSDLERSKSFTRLYATLLLPVVVGDNIDARNKRRSDKEYNWRKLFAEELARLVGGVRCE